MRAIPYMLVMSLVAPATLYAQTVYKCTEADGTVVYSERACATDPAQVETIDTSSALKTGSGGSVAEQGAIVRGNEIQRACNERIQAVRGRYVAVYGQIAQDAASLEARNAANDYRSSDSAYQAEIRSSLASLSAERAKFNASEAKELAAAQEKCRTEMEAEAKRNSEAEAARAETRSGDDSDGDARNPG